MFTTIYMLAYLTKFGDLSFDPSMAKFPEKAQCEAMATVVNVRREPSDKRFCVPQIYSAQK